MGDRNGRLGGRNGRLNSWHEWRGGWHYSQNRIACRLRGCLEGFATGTSGVPSKALDPVTWFNSGQCRIGLGGLRLSGWRFSNLFACLTLTTLGLGGAGVGADSADEEPAEVDGWSAAVLTRYS